jgi:antitoxin component YwqK of YwqJK toxin-antitoxin module
LNDKKNGKGKEYNYSGKLLFEGEFKDGKRKIQ